MTLPRGDEIPDSMRDMNAKLAGIDLEAVRYMLATSPRWDRFQRAEGVTMAAVLKVGVMRLDEWTIGDCFDARDWCMGAREYPPEVIERYFDQLRKAAG